MAQYHVLNVNQDIWEAVKKRSKDMLGMSATNLAKSYIIAGLDGVKTPATKEKQNKKKQEVEVKSIYKSDPMTLIYCPNRNDYEADYTTDPEKIEAFFNLREEVCGMFPEALEHAKKLYIRFSDVEGTITGDEAQAAAYHYKQYECDYINEKRERLHRIDIPDEVISRPGQPKDAVRIEDLPKLNREEV